MLLSALRKLVIIMYCEIHIANQLLTFFGKAESYMKTQHAFVVQKVTELDLILLASAFFIFHIYSLPIYMYYCIF